MTVRHAEFSDLALVNTIWGAAMLGFNDKAMLETVAGEAITRMDAFESQQLSTTLVATARSGHMCVPLLEVRLPWNRMMRIPQRYTNDIKCESLSQLSQLVLNLRSFVVLLVNVVSCWRTRGHCGLIGRFSLCMRAPRT